MFSSTEHQQTNTGKKMKDKIIRQCAMFGRVLTFWKTNSGDLPAGSKGAAYVTSLESVSSGLVNAGATQKANTVAAQNARLLALDTDLLNIARTAKAIAQDEPGFDDRFAQPQHVIPREVLGTAAAYLNQLAVQPADDAAMQAAKAALVKQFTDHALPATFVADLQASLDAYGTTRDEHETELETGMASTAAIARQVREGVKLVNHLDAIARNLYGEGTDQLRVWISASHVERNPDHVPPKPAPAPAPTTTATTPPAK
jgi:hypothetical protein